MSDTRRDARFDEAIDRAVREMLDVEPPADLRAKVVARIDDLPASGLRLPAFGFRRFGGLGFGVLAAAAVLMIAVAISRLSAPSVTPATTVAAADTNLPADVRSVPVVHESPRPGSRTSGPAVVRTPGTAARAAEIVVAAAANEPENATTDITPLKTMTPIDVAPITQRSIAPESVGVQPLNPITELRFTPLNPPDRRN